MTHLQPDDGGCGRRHHGCMRHSSMMTLSTKNYVRRLLDFKLQADDALHRQISAKTDMLGLDDMPPRIWVNRILQECAS